MRSDTGCVGIAVFNSDICIQHRTVESACIGITYTSFRVIIPADEPEEIFPFARFAGYFLETG